MLVGRVEAWAASRRRSTASWHADTDGHCPDGLTFLVATSGRGLLQYSRGRFTTVLSGHTFGVTALDTTLDTACGAGAGVVVFQATGLHGRLVLLTRPAAGGPHPVWTGMTLLWGLTRGVHQVRARGDDLLVADTYRNRLLLFSVTELLAQGGRSCRASRAVRTAAYPAGRLSQGQRSPNYRHFNSLLPGPDGSWQVMAHNDTRKTGRPSQIYTLDRELNVLTVTDAGGGDCHDLLPDRLGRLMFCRSAQGTLAVDGIDVVAVPQFTRGLAIGDDVILLGGSPRGDRAERGLNAGFVYVLGSDFSLRGRLTLPPTQVHDLCLVPPSASAGPPVPEPAG